MRRVLLGLAIVASGCSRAPILEDSPDGDGTTGEPPDVVTTDSSPAPPGPGTTDPGPGSTTGIDDDDDADADAATEDDADGRVFLPAPDGGPAFECDLFEDDCPPGEKCSPWANDGGSTWNATHCTPIADDPAAPGEPCITEAPNSGIDDCEAGATCWYVDEETHEGTCVSFCTGDEANPICEDPDTVCNITSDGLYILCIPTCDPLGQDCPMGQGCYGIGEDFVCAPDVSPEGTTAGSECEFLNVCPAGTACIGSSYFETCESSGCCSSFCSLDDAAPPCLAGQACLPWYESGQAPPGEELIGVCGVPQ